MSSHRVTSELQVQSVRRQRKEKSAGEGNSFQHSVDNMVGGLLYVYMAQGV